ncbi:hypothetical protein LRR81_17475 [Metabacillus sp. GX 13764]|uniref:hypothetical protein n=1 Tax=Metabacillus kandeliae TaxID=2900151 RepID=UPI001E4C34E0|nr:hypothetical protein [Metabacillus kandeliae]MCD7036034.1 hypothetical protein [Metabacillus kandeliae]
MNYAAPAVDYSTMMTTADQAWFLIFVAVLLALGATVVLGAAVWCVAHNHGNFTGGVQFKDFGFKVNIHCSR